MTRRQDPYARTLTEGEQTQCGEWYRVKAANDPAPLSIEADISEESS